jgi:hypothetical protein
MQNCLDDVVAANDTRSISQNISRVEGVVGARTHLLCAQLFMVSADVTFLQEQACSCRSLHSAAAVQAHTAALQFISVVVESCVRCAVRRQKQRHRRVRVAAAALALYRPHFAGARGTSQQLWILRVRWGGGRWEVGGGRWDGGGWRGRCDICNVSEHSQVHQPSPRARARPRGLRRCVPHAMLQKAQAAAAVGRASWHRQLAAHVRSLWFHLTGVEMVVKGDGRAYTFNIKTDSVVADDMYQHPFRLPSGLWHTLRLPWESFIRTRRGKELSSQHRLDPSNIIRYPLFSPLLLRTSRATTRPIPHSRAAALQLRHQRGRPRGGAV